MPRTGGFGGGEARGVAGATARKPISSRPTAAAPPSNPPSAPRGPAVSSRPTPAPGNVYQRYRRVEPVRGSPNVYVYDRRPVWGFIPFWWHPPIYTPAGALVSPGGANPLAVFLTVAGIAVVIGIGVTLFRHR